MFLLSGLSSEKRGINFWLSIAVITVFRLNSCDLARILVQIRIDFLPIYDMLGMPSRLLIFSHRMCVLRGRRFREDL